MALGLHAIMYLVLLAAAGWIVCEFDPQRLVMKRVNQRVIRLKDKDLVKELQSPPSWATWVLVCNLQGEGTPEDLEVVDWLRSQAPNPNCRSLEWWLDVLSSDVDWKNRDWMLPAFWIRLPWLSRNGNIYWDMQRLVTLETIEANVCFRVPHPTDHLNRDRFMDAFQRSLGRLQTEDTILVWSAEEPLNRYKRIIGKRILGR